MIGWSFVDRGGWLCLRLAWASQTPGEIVCHYWRQPCTAAEFRRTYGWEGDPDPLPMSLHYVAPGLYRNEKGRDFRTMNDSAASAVAIVPVLQPTKGVRLGTEFRWDSVWGRWERLYKKHPHWRAVPRLLGDERPAPQEGK